MGESRNGEWHGEGMGIEFIWGGGDDNALELVAMAA